MANSILIEAIIKRIKKEYPCEADNKCYISDIIRNSKIYPFDFKTISYDQGKKLLYIYRKIYANIALDYLSEIGELESFIKYVEEHSMIKFSEWVNYYQTHISFQYKKFLYIDSFGQDPYGLWFFYQEIDDKIRRMVEQFFNSFSFKK